MRIIVRHAEDDLAALNIANAMEAAGAQVFSITYNGSAPYRWTTEPHTCLTVWAKVGGDDQIDAVDEKIDAFAAEFQRGK